MSAARIIHTPEEISRIRRAALVTASVRDELAALTRPGMSTFEVDRLAGELITRTGGISAFKNYGGFPGNICISVNDEVIHGIGRDDVIIKEQDIVSIDVGVKIDGAMGDTALTFGFTEQPDDVKRLLDGTREALMEGISAARCGAFVHDISAAVENAPAAVNSPSSGNLSVMDAEFSSMNRRKYQTIPAAAADRGLNREWCFASNPCSTSAPKVSRSIARINGPCVPAMANGARILSI